jgi:hypothetical protein
MHNVGYSLMSIRETLKTTKGAIKNGQSRYPSNIRYKTEWSQTEQKHNTEN